MAILKSGKLHLEFSHEWFIDDEILTYRVNLLWDGKPVLNDGILDERYFSDEAVGSVELSEDYSSSFPRFLRIVLEENTPSAWWPIDTYLLIEVYPKMSFPFSWNFRTSNSEIVRTKDDKIIMELDKKFLYDDIVTIVVLIDRCHFIDSHSRSNEGVSFILTVTRKKIEKFCKKLENEVEFVKKYRRYYNDEENDLRIFHINSNSFE